MILGQVVDAASARPVSGAIVTLQNSSPVRVTVPPNASAADRAAAQAAAQAASAPRRIMADGQGIFVFHGLPKGSFRLSVDAPGYLSGGFGQQRVNGPTRQLDLDQAEHRSGVNIKLWAYASISGTVQDDGGEPAVGVAVRLLRITMSGAARRLSPAEGVQTDDRGMYRFGSLSPGDYMVALPQTVTSMPASTIDAFLAASNSPNGTGDFTRDLSASGAPMPNPTGIRLGTQQIQLTGGQNRPLAPPAPAPDGRVVAYQTLFYPASPTSAGATTISLTSGLDRVGVDLQLRMVQTVKVSGTLTGPDGPAPNMGIKLLPSGMDSLLVDNGFETATTATDASGAFTFPAVPTGAYTVKVLRVPRPAPPAPPPPPPPGAGRGAQVLMPSPVPALPAEATLWAEFPVSVGDSDVANLDVALRIGARITGRIVFEGSATPVTPDMLQRMTVSVSPADGRPMLVNSQGRVDATGQFATPGYPPGRYFLSANAPGPGWFFKSATLGGRNLDDDPLDIQGGDVSGATITFTDRTTELAGNVRDATNTGELNAMVIVFPADYAAWIDHGMSNRRTRSTSVGKPGTFRLTGLPPGDYLAVAINPDMVGDVRDVRTWAPSLARAATRFSLGDGEKRTLDLVVSQIR